jgi:hypothetical protein
VNDIAQASILPGDIKKQTWVQDTALIQIPDWLRDVPLPVLVDKVSFQAMYGTQIQIYTQGLGGQKKRVFGTKMDELE